MSCDPALISLRTLRAVVTTGYHGLVGHMEELPRVEVTVFYQWPVLCGEGSCSASLWHVM